jgi:hypothetical protein
MIEDKEFINIEILKGATREELVPSDGPDEFEEFHATELLWIPRLYILHEASREAL